MKKLRGITKALIWVMFTVPVVAGGTVYYFESVAACTQADVIALLLWICVMLLLTGLTALLSRWTDQKPGFLCPGEGMNTALEIICCVILVGAGIYFRIGHEFVAFWARQDGNPVVEAALVTLNRTAGGQNDLISAVYVYLLNQLFLLVGNLSLAAAYMQLMFFVVGGVLLYFLIRRCYGAFTAVICLGGLMLLPQMIRASLYCSPEILLFLAAVILGWVLHLCLDRRLHGSQRALLDLLTLIFFVIGCAYVDSPEWKLLSGNNLSERLLSLSGQTALILGVFCAVIFLFLESWKTAAVYMFMAVLLLMVQFFGLADNVGCMAAFGIVMSILFGISLGGLLFRGCILEPEKAAEKGAAEKASAAEIVTEKAVKDKPADAAPAAAETSAETARAENETTVETAGAENETTVEKASEIFIPESMEIPERKKRAKIDYDREFSEAEMNFDLEVEEGEEFDK